MASRTYFLGISLLVALLVVTVFLSVGVGAVPLTPGEVLAALVSKGTDAAQSTDSVIIWDLRIPRIILAVVIGAALAAAGAAFQGLFRNPLADPFAVGASSGAALGASLVIVLGVRSSGAGMGPVPFAAFIGALLAVAIVYGVSAIGETAPVVALILAGTALSTLLSAIVSLLMLTSDRGMHEIFAWLLGGLSGRSWPQLQATWPYLVLGSAALWLFARPLDALALGDETAQSLGLSIQRARAVIVLLATLATAAAVSASGVIAFVGLIAPHIARLLFGSSHRRLMPAAMLIGSLLLLLADDVARTAFAPLEIPVGIVTSLLGGPFFLYLLKSRQRLLGG